MSSSSPYRVDSTPHSGLGLFAARPIKLGELIICEQPIFIVPDPSGVEAALEALPPAKKDIFFSLVGTLTSDTPPSTNIFLSNAVQSGTAGGGIYEYICRINHSCSPTATWSWSQSTNHQSVYALTDITEGTEITTAYIPTSRSRAKRQELLLKLFHFTCQCRACSTPSHTESDSRRERIGELERLIKAASESEDYPGGLRLISEKIRLMDQEGLYDFVARSDDYFGAAKIATCCNKDDMVSQFMGLSYAYRLLAAGPLAASTKRLRRLLEYPDVTELINWWDARETQDLPIICDACGMEDGEGGFEGREGKKAECRDCGGAIWCSVACKVEHYPIHRPVCLILRGM